MKVKFRGKDGGWVVKLIRSENLQKMRKKHRDGFKVLSQPILPKDAIGRGVLGGLEGVIQKNAILLLHLSRSSPVAVRQTTLSSERLSRSAVQEVLPME